MAKKKVAKKLTAKQKWLRKDATYLEQQAAANAAFKRFKSGQGINLSQYKKTHERNVDDNKRSRTQALTGVNENFAARGMANSGAFQTSRDETSDAYARQLAALKTGLSNFKQDQGYELSNATAQKNDTIKRALRDATERYAQRQYL